MLIAKASIPISPRYDVAPLELDKCRLGPLPL